MNDIAMCAPQIAVADMIPKSPAHWQQCMREAITSPQELLRLLNLDVSTAELATASTFPLRVPRGFVARMRKGDPRDPLLLQVLPLVHEDCPSPGFVSDPVGDLASSRAHGLLHKYPGRALLIATGACAIHCRYCFRREFPYGEQNARRREWQDALQLLRADESIHEVILSGGDPLSLSDTALASLSEQLDAIPHLKRLRIHSRHPVVLPERVDDHLLAWLTKSRLQPILVLHCNHPQELNEEVRQALQKLKSAGISLFNQSVLLRGINDSLQVLSDLSQELFTQGVIPYYLHQLDRVQGAAHFEVPDSKAIELHNQLRNLLPGYMLPALVREVPGELSKTPILQSKDDIRPS